MNNKYKIILFSFLTVAIIFFCLFAFVGYELELVFGKKYDKSEVIEEYEANKALYLNSIEELNNENDNISFYKENKRVIINLKNDKKNRTLNEQEKNKYMNTYKIINKNMIKSIIKTDKFIEFYIASPYGPDQSIVYLKNEEKYNSERNIINESKIDKNLYYIEID